MRMPAAKKPKNRAQIKNYQKSRVNERLWEYSDSVFRSKPIMLNIPKHRNFMLTRGELKERKHYEKIDKNRSSKSGRYDAVDRMRSIL